MPRRADCLVTGATGFLGRSVLYSLLTQGVFVRCLVRRRGDVWLASADSPAQDSNPEAVYGNLLSPIDMDRAVEGVRVVYHLAGESRGLPATIFAGTVVGSKNLLQAILRRRPERVLLVSSLNVYSLANADPKIPVAEDFPMEERAEKRDVYTHAKVWQEQLFREYLAGSGVELTVLRPGYIYGHGQSHLPTRMGLCLGNLLLQVKPKVPLPVTYVKNCADAIVFCGRSQRAANETYNIVDDELPTGSQYLRFARRSNPGIRGLASPFWVYAGLAHFNRWAHKASAGQIPLALTRYKAGCAWRGHSFSNQKLKNLGWRQPVATTDALEHTFSNPRLTEEYLEAQLRDAA
jgi:nucleoside-diphosphate-sugar epimerase